MSLETIIKKSIQKNGPMTVADFMSLALTHPKHGYYMHKDPLGKGGDFITAPEISQIFGEIIGVWLAVQWMNMGKPRTTLVELGPGRGTLMADILRATKNAPGFHDAISVHLVEASPHLKQKQWNTLAGKHPDIRWHDNFDEVPEGPILLVANEFFDALPIRQYVYLEGSWHERMVILGVDGELHFSIPTAAGRMVERCEAGKEWASRMGKRMMTYGGAALIVDYGYNGPTKNSQETLQAMRGHAYHDILKDPGKADLTAHVDFHAVAQAAREEGAAAYGIVSQAHFLKSLGAEARWRKLTEKATAEQKASITLALERLLSPEQMGDLFKVLCITHPNHPKPEGF